MDPSSEIVTLATEIALAIVFTPLVVTFVYHNFIK